MVGGILMNHNNKLLNKKRYNPNIIIPIFFGAGIGTFLGLIAYVKDWL